MNKHYKYKTSGFVDWEQKDHAEDYLLYPKNLGEYLSLDELSLSNGELYTYLTNKAGKGKKGTLVASIKGTKSKDIIEIIKKIPLTERKKVKEISLDMASNMNLVALECFPNAEIVTDRFHVVRLVQNATQHVRVTYRWEAIKQENEQIKEAKKKGDKFVPIVLSNGDTIKQLLARSRYILAKTEKYWTKTQAERAKLLFELYPDIKKAYYHAMEFRNIFELTDKRQAEIKIIDWIDRTRELGFDHFNTAANSIYHHLHTILNFFNNRHTNANAESFNSKIKLFRANLRGVVDVKFFLFRLDRLYA